MFFLTEDLIQLVGIIDAKIKKIENSPNCVFELLEYETLDLFHSFNISFKTFWDNFDRHSASQLLLCHQLLERHSELSNSFEWMFRKQLNYLGRVVDGKGQCVKNLRPVVFSEDRTKDVLGYYEENLKYNTDENGKPIYNIDVDRDRHHVIVNGQEVSISYYKFRNDKLNNAHNDGLLSMWNSLTYTFELMCTVWAYPGELVYGHEIDTEEILNALENESRQYAKDVGRKVEIELRRSAQYKKSSRHVQLTPDVWGLVMDEEDDLYRLAISGTLEDNNEKRFENIFKEQRKLLTNNASLLQKIMSSAIDGELFDIRLSVETHNLLTALNAGNLDLFYELILKRNIIQREMYPEELRKKYEEWANPPEELQQEDGDDDGLSDARQSKLDEIIMILRKGNWKEPATSENIALLLETVFGKELSLLEDDDKPLCDKMWALVEGGRGDRMKIVPANLAGFFSEENLLAGSSKDISNDLFGSEDQKNNINKGNSNYCSSDSFSDVIPFLKKYIKKIIRPE